MVLLQFQNLKRSKVFGVIIDRTLIHELAKRMSVAKRSASIRSFAPPLEVILGA